MCFSAGASFGAGVVLSVVGVAAIRKARTSSQILFASIPLTFAVQQTTEGFLWLALTDPAYAFLQAPATYNFLFFAQVVWPAWVPLAILRLEPDEGRHTIGKILVFIGLIISIYLFYCLANYHVEAKLLSYHISYVVDYPKALGSYGSIMYVVATIAPPFFSRLKNMWMLGVSVLISYIITTIFYTDYLVSVWCFFASVISIAVYFIMHKLDERFSQTTFRDKSQGPEKRNELPSK